MTVHKRKVRAYKQAAEWAERRARVLELRKQGWSFQAIGDELKVSVQRAHQLATEALADLKRESAQEAVDLDLARLDELLASNWELAMSGDPRAGDMVLKVMDRKAKYLGLDAPAKLAGPDGGAIPIGATVKAADESFAGFIGILGKLAADKAQGAGAESAVAGNSKAEPTTA